MTEQKTLAIAFADVRGSTRIYEKYGDVRGRELTAWSVNAFCQAAAEHGGTVIKTMGDGAMITFPTAEAALVAAIATQEAHAGKEVASGIGFHFGNVIEENADVFGDAVNVAARLCGLAKAGEILTTEETVKHFPALMQSMCRHIDTTMVKGRREPVAIHQVVWESSSDATMTVIAGAPAAAAMPAKRREKTLTLALGGQEWKFDGASEALTLGRQQASIVVPDGLASRQHATLDSFRGKFLLTDQSTNGTFILFDRGGETVLRRDNAELSDSGYIGLGRPPSPDNPFRIRFVVTPGDD